MSVGRRTVTFPSFTMGADLTKSSLFPDPDKFAQVLVSPSTVRKRVSGVYISEAPSFPKAEL